MDSARQKRWIIRDSEGRVKGPYSTRALLQRISEGKVNESDEVSRYPGGTWLPISKNPEFYDRLLETLAAESSASSKKENRQNQNTGRTPIDPTRRGRVVEDTEDEFVMTSPKPLPAGGESGDGQAISGTHTSTSADGKTSTNTGTEPEEELLSRMDVVDTVSKNNVLDLEDKKQIIKSYSFKKLWKPLLAVVLVVGCLVVYLMTPGAPKGRIHLRAPLTEGQKLSPDELQKAYFRAKALYYSDRFTAYWKAQNQLITLLGAHPKSKPLLSLLCLVYRELWPYSYQSPEDLAVFSEVVGKTRKMDPNGKDGILCESALALSRGQLQKAQNLIETALPHNVREPVFYEMRANVWGSQRKYSLALDYLRTIQNLEPNWIKPYREQSEFLVKKNQIPEAVRVLEALLAKNPKHEIGHIELGALTYQYLKKGDKAREHIVFGLKNSQQLPPLVKVRGYKTLAAIHLKDGNKERAIENLKLAYRFNPNDREVQRQLARLGEKGVLQESKKKGNEILALAEHYERQGDCFAAQAQYRAFFVSNPKNARAAFKAANCLWKMSRAKEAIEWLDKALVADPKYIEAYVKKAEFYSERFDFQAASAVLKRARKVNPKSHLVYRGLAQLHLKRNDYASAQSFAGKALDLYQTDVESMTILIRAMIGQKQFGKAYEKAVQLRSFDPANPEVQEVYIRSLAAVRNLESAMGVARELIENYPYTIEYRFLYGELLKEDERYSLAEGVFRQVLQIDESFRPAMLELGQVLKVQGKFNEARDLFLQAASQDPSDAKALFLLGQLYRRAGNAKAALTQFGRVLQNNPLYPNAHYFAGVAALDVRDFSRALKEAQKEAKLNPYRADPHILMGDVYFFLRDYPNCIAAYQQAIKLRPPNSDLYIKQARCFRLNGSLHTALQLLRTAELKESGNPLVWKEMGAACEMKENINCAIEAYRQYLRLAPNAADRKIIEGRIGEMYKR